MARNPYSDVLVSSDDGFHRCHAWEMVHRGKPYPLYFGIDLLPFYPKQSETFEQYLGQIETARAIFLLSGKP